MEITCTDIKGAFKGFHQRELQEFTLTFSLIPAQGTRHEKREIGTIPLLLQKEKLRIRITRRLEGPVVLPSGSSKGLELRAEIDSLDNPLKNPIDHPFRQPIYLTVGMSGVDSCKLIKKTVPIPVHTTPKSRQHEFTLTIETGDVNFTEKDER